MKLFLILFLFINCLYSDDIDLILEYDYQDNKENQKTLISTIEYKKEFNEFLLYTKIESLKDYDNNSRKYIKSLESYIKYYANNYEILIGRDIKYWGSLELYNVTDIYNQKNIVNNLYDQDKKLGTNNITYTYFLENDNELVLILSENNKQYIKYSGSSNDIISRDFSYIISSDEFITYHTFIQEENIVKFEYKYNFDENKYQSGLGLEHTLYNFINKKDLGILLEYYKSNELVLLNDDLFLGCRLTFNDTNNSDIIMGIIDDISTNNHSKSIEYNTRIYDNTKINIVYMSDINNDLININIRYYF
jgi:hypothetical protein